MTVEESPRPSIAGVSVRRGGADDLARLTEIYNHYIVHTPITFDVEPVTVEQRRPWLEQFADSGRRRLFVAEEGGAVLGYADTHQFRQKAAYDTSVESTVYLAPEATGRGIGSLLYTTLFDAIADTGVRMALAGVTLPNDASVALHERFGFTLVGVMHEVGYKFGRYWDVGWYEKRLG
ncbi:MAG: N-acetyltransferase family protein [Dehalococcoidia bacterium]